MSRRILLHVGTPKTGTSYLQDVLFRNREHLREAGVLYPGDRFDAHFLAALDLMRLPWGGLETEAVGAWERLARAVREYDDTAIISHEILATASRSQAARALESLGHRPDARPGEGAEVHLVLSARDLVRQIPAEWQENVKHRATVSFREFLDLIRDPSRESRIGSWFWGVQELPDILARWGATIPPERVHVVTVPAPGGAPEVLWKRFCQAFGLDDHELDLGTDRTNPSLGAPETALIRRINRAANQELPPSHYRPLVRELLAHQTLSRRTGSPRLSLPPDDHAWVRELEDAWIAELQARGYDVIGDLDELRGAAADPGAKWLDPDRPRERLVADAAVDAIKALLLDGAHLRTENERLHDELAATRAELERAYLRLGYRIRHGLVVRMERNAVGRGALWVYRALRGRNSRSA